MSNFLTNDFLLTTKVAKRLYHDTAAHLPIIDYHCHLTPSQVAEDYRFNNLTDIWLRGDHYKWRAMRTNGVDERFCTGDASDYDKFLAWAKTVPYAIGNPLYHWTHLELKRPFGIDKTLNEESAPEIWEQCNAMLNQPEFSALGIMNQMNVKMVGTTDDPIDDLSAHKKVMDDSRIDVKMLPSWRPDKAFNIQATTYLEYLDKLSSITSININSFATLCEALRLRLEHFALHGCCIADHALDVVVYEEATEDELNQVLEKRFANLLISDKEAAQLKTAVLIFLGREYHRRGWVQQYHIGALRNNNQRMFTLMGADIGFDSIHDQLVAEPLSKLMNALDRDDLLPKTILYCLNPRDNEVLATMCGNFQGGIAGKIQFGSGWWFNDQKDGMLRQLEQLSQLGLLSRFVGMLTDSRSFLSYTRHEYFRRLLCRMIGEWVENGEAPNDMPLLTRMVEDICFDNANRYFELNLDRG